MSTIVNSDPQNRVKPNVPRNSSTFPLSYLNADTMRFGEYHPHLCIDGLSKDKLPWRCATSARSYTLKAPLLQGISMNKDYFLVNLRSILPLQGERIITNPNIGDDVPEDAYCSVSDFLSRIESVFSYYLSLASESYSDDKSVFLTWLFKSAVFSQSVFSNGCLLSSLGCHLASRFSYKPSDIKYDNDYWFDTLSRLLVSSLEGASNPIRASIDGNDFWIYASREDANKPYGPNFFHISVREFIEMIRDTSNWIFLDTQSIVTSFDNFYSLLSGLSIDVQGDFPFDLSRLWAYQLICAEYYSDDKVDYIYSAEVFREYISSLVGSLASSTFDWNGLKLPYDYLSAKVFNSVCTSVVDGDDSDSPWPLFQYFLTLFGYNRSLRYKDYFTGSRVRPLAVGDSSVPVVNNSVDIVDVSRHIQAQRFRNAVNAVGRKFEDYLAEILGERPVVDAHNPLFLAHSSDGIGTQEIENTGSDQLTKPQSVTAVFRCESNNFEFSVDVKEPCIILGVTSFDIKRAYVNSIDRSFFTRDRYDMFIPEMQFVGDQPIYQHELDSSCPNQFGSPFGYTYHDMQYKIIADRAQGGFAAGSLPGFLFMLRPNTFETTGHISPDFIRSKPSELDDFYVSLSGFSLGTYFHFIVVNENICDATRAMAANPQIL